MDETRPRRNPATEVFISDVGPESSRVALVGRIKSKSDTVAVLEDASGSISLLFQEQGMLSELDPGEIYRVIGVVLPHEDGVELKVEIVQKFSGFDLEAYYSYLKRKKYK